MLTKARRALRLVGCLLLIISITCLTLSTAAAFDGPRNNKAAVQASERDPSQSAQRRKAFSVRYTLYNGAVAPGSDAEPTVGAPGSPAPPPPAPPPVSTAPMTA